MPLVCSQNRTGFNVKAVIVVSLVAFIFFFMFLPSGVRLEDVLTFGKPGQKPGPMGVARFLLV